MSLRVAWLGIVLLLALGPALESIQDATRSPPNLVAQSAFGGDGWTPPSSRWSPDASPSGGASANRLDATSGSAEATLACPCQLDLVLPEGRSEIWLHWNAGLTAPLAPALVVSDQVVGPGTLPDGALFRVDGSDGPFTLHIRETAVVTVQAGSYQPDVLLPNLIAMVPAHLGKDVPSDHGRATKGCLASDAAPASAACLRFSTAMANDGPGDLRLEWLGPAGVVQHVGNVTRPAGFAEFHGIHGHVHYTDVVAFEVHRVEEDGRRGDGVVTGGKTGFCLVDWGHFNGSATPERARQFWRRDCEQGLGLHMGVTAGHFDVYRWFLPEQQVNVADLPDGVYELVVTIDPLGLLAQSERRDDQASLRFELKDGVATPLGGRGLVTLVDL